MDNGFTYPAPDIDPRDKQFDWYLQYCKAAWADSTNYMPAAMLFSRSMNRFWEIKQYALGKQSITKYKKIQPGDDIDNNTELNNDSSVLAIICKFIEIAKSKILQREYNLEAFAVDPLAKSEEDEYFNQMKIKIMMNEIMQQQGSPLANSPNLKLNPDEPQDLEQLKMQMDFTYKHAMALNAEEGMQLIMGQNNFEHQRENNVSNLYDYGIGGYKVWINEKGMPQFRAIHGDNIITSYCVDSEFTDAVHAGEIRQVPVMDLVPYFDKNKIHQICTNVAGKFGNPAQFDVRQNRWWDKFNVMVLDLQWFTWNSTVYKTEYDKLGNERFRKTDYKNMQFVEPAAMPSTMSGWGSDGYADEEYYLTAEDDMKGGEQTPKYSTSTEKVVCKGSWLIGTDFMYDWGLKENQHSALSSWWDKKLDYILGAWNFYKMQFTGITERLIPLGDAYQLAWRKLQNFKNKLVPYLIELDLTALENVGLGKGNDALSPQQIIDFAFSNNILLKRTQQPYTNNSAYKSMEIHATGMLEAFAQLYADLDRIYIMIQQVSGLNELTDGSTPNAKTLVPVANAAIASTNNALYLISNCEKKLIQRLGQAIVEKIQISVGLGKVEGFAKALGSSTVKFFQINPNISLYELGIFITDNLSPEERQMLLQEINLKESQGLLTPADKLMVLKCKNITQAMIYLNYIVNKRQEENHGRQMQLIQQQSQGNAQNLQMAEQMKQQTMILQHKLMMEEISAKGQWDYIIEAAKKASDLEEGKQQGMAKVISAQIAANAKQVANSMSA